jgi:hypothetical protein
MGPTHGKMGLTMELAALCSSPWPQNCIWRTVYSTCLRWSSHCFPRLDFPRLLGFCLCVWWWWAGGSRSENRCTMAVLMALGCRVRCHWCCRAWRGGEEAPFLLDNVWDLGALLDYLEQRPDVDHKRIGMTGVSLGGWPTDLSARQPICPCLNGQAAMCYVDQKLLSNRIRQYRWGVQWPQCCYLSVCLSVCLDRAQFVAAWVCSGPIAVCRSVCLSVCLGRALFVVCSCPNAARVQGLVERRGQALTMRCRVQAACTPGCARHWMRGWLRRRP